jgi:hypothetical protein
VSVEDAFSETVGRKGKRKAGFSREPRMVVLALADAIISIKVWRLAGRDPPVLKPRSEKRAVKQG